MINHDRLFKELLIEFFFDFIELFLSELAAYLDKNSLVFLDKEVFTDVPSGETHEADLVVKARFRNQESFFLVHGEHQAQPQAGFNRRMFQYFVRLHEKHALPVYPIVVFSHDSARSEPDVYEVTFPDLPVLRFQYQTIQLSRLNWRDFLNRPNPVASALMSKMKMAPEERPRVKLECLRLLATLKLNPARMRLISGFVDTSLRLTREETLIFNRQADTLLERKEKETIMELTTSWKEEGRQEGRYEANQQLVLRQLRRRWRDLDPALVARVRALPVEPLETLAEDLLDFTGPADLESWLNRRL